MDKPHSLSVKDYLIRLLSIKTNTAAKTIEAIVDFQMQGANEALRTNDSIELSGFGKFLFNRKKAHKKFDKNISKEDYFMSLLADPNITDQKRKSVMLKLENTRKTLESIKPKLYGNQADGGRVEESSPAPTAPEGIDREDISGENSNM